MKDNYIQLRNHHLKQGRNNDRTPIYPITKPECIKGLMDYIENNTDGSSSGLGYDENTGIFYATVNDAPVIVAHTLTKMAVTSIATSNALVAAVTLDPTVYHEVEDCDSLTIADVADDTYDYSLCTFIGRFTANSDDVTITLPSGILPADSNPDTEAGHTYEYNIFDGVFSLIDVTTTQESNG